MVRDRIDALGDFRKQLEGAYVDLLREMVRVCAEQLMGADADAACGAGRASDQRIGSTAETATGNAPGTPTSGSTRSPRKPREVGRS